MLGWFQNFITTSSLWWFLLLQFLASCNSEWRLFSIFHNYFKDFIFIWDLNQCHYCFTSDSSRRYHRIVTSHSTKIAEIKSNNFAFTRMMMMNNISSNYLSNIDIENWSIPKAVRLTYPMFEDLDQFKCLNSAELRMCHIHNWHRAGCHNFVLNCRIVFSFLPERRNTFFTLEGS